MRKLNLLALTGVLWMQAPALWAQQDITCAVETQRGGAVAVTGADRRDLVPGMAVALQDRVETSAAGIVTLLCPDELRITVGPESIVVLVDVSADAGGWGAMLPKGIARFARPLFGGARFEVRTPSAVASVRSTTWSVEVLLGATAVFVTDGNVAVEAGGESVELPAGIGVDVMADGTMKAPSAWGPARIVATERRLNPPAE